MPSVATVRGGGGKDLLPPSYLLPFFVFFLPARLCLFFFLPPALLTPPSPLALALPLASAPAVHPRCRSPPPPPSTPDLASTASVAAATATAPSGSGGRSSPSLSSTGVHNDGPTAAASTAPAAMVSTTPEATASTRPTGPCLVRHGTAAARRALGCAWASPEASRAGMARHGEVAVPADTARRGLKPVVRVPCRHGPAQLPALLLSEGTRNTRQSCGESGGGGGGSDIGNASYRDGGGGIGPARTSGANTGILDEQVLSLVFRSINWDPQAVCRVARASRRLRAVAERVLWRGLCISRAPRMVDALTRTAGGGSGAPPPGRIGGGWPALAKLLFFCCGAAGSAVPGHFTRVSRFSKTSGQSFLSRRCRGDLLHVSDPCEHAVPGAADDVGAYRGVFRGFMRSRTWACLVDCQAALDTRVRCPYCGARVWSMVAAGLVPRSAWRRVGSYEGRLEYYVCVSGHVHGNCWLAHLTSSDGEHDDDSDDDTSGGSGGGGDDDGNVELLSVAGPPPCVPWIGGGAP